MKTVVLALLLTLCGLGGCVREAAPAVDPDASGERAPVAMPDLARPPVAAPSAPATDAPSPPPDAGDAATFAGLSIPPTWQGSDAEYAADPLRCASLVRDAPRAQGCDALPADILAFLDRRASCEHWRGEPYAEPAELAAADPDERAALQARRDTIVRNVLDECRGTDAALAALKQRYPADAALHDFFSAFEDRIED